MDNNTVDIRASQDRWNIREIPYDLPDELDVRIKLFMNRIGLECGSLDFVLTTNDDYYFLEVNPVGQFGWVSEICNYNLYSVVAEYLINRYEREYVC